MTIYVFDMDGTLTPPRKPMEDEFLKKFLPWAKENKTFIVTGSDMNKIKEQITFEMIDAFTGIYSSMGNEFWRGQTRLEYNNFEAPSELIDDLEKYRAQTTYPYQLFGNYIERRTGMLNFSVIGRDCPYEEREKYFAWDSTHHEREKIQDKLLKKYPEFEVSIGGMISMDIIKKGFGKDQVAQKLRLKYPNDLIVFFGDKTFEGGNDYALAHALELMDSNTKIVQVSGPSDVLSFLKL